MAVCLGHSERGARVSKIMRMLDSPQQTPEEGSGQKGDKPQGAGGELCKHA